MAGTKVKLEKVPWSGQIMGIQPRIRLMRSFDERQHSYQGYNLHMNGTCGNETGEFIIAVGKGAHEKHQFCAGMKVSGLSLTVDDTRLEDAQFYKTSGIKIEMNLNNAIPTGPPYTGVPPDLPTYRERGHRRLDAKTYGTKCLACIWGCKMPVEITVDHWKPSGKKYRFETFCYGPKSCKLYRSGPTRKVTGRQGMVWEEGNWVDEDATSHRGEDD